MGDNDNIAAEEERLMRHISKKRPTGTVTSNNTQQNNQQPTLPKRTSFTYKKPEPTPVVQNNQQQPKKWQQQPTVDLDMKKKAEEMERQRQEEVRQQQELERKLREQAQGKSTRNDFSIDRFLIKQDDSSNLKSGNYETESRNDYKAHVKEDDSDALAKEEQRLMKKLGEKSKPVLYTPEAIEEHRKKLESQAGVKPSEAPVIRSNSSGPNPKQKLATTISKNLSTARSRKPKDLSLITSAAEWLYKFNTFLTKIQGSLLFSRYNFTQFNFQSFEDGSVGIVSFIADNLVVLDHEKKPLKSYDGFVNAGIKLVEKIASSNEWSDELESDLIEVQKTLFELVSDVLRRAIEIEEKARRKEETKNHLTTVIIFLFEISQNLNTAVMNYHPTKYKSLLRELVQVSTSTYYYIDENKLDPIVDLIQSIIDSAKKFMQSSGEDIKENDNLHQKISTLMNKLQELLNKTP